MREVVKSPVSWKIIVLLVISCNACLTATRHNESLAAKRAIEFAKVAFIEHDVFKAHNLLSEKAKQNISVEKLSEVLAKMHSSSFPSAITGAEYEPVPGQQAIKIFLYGENQNEKFYYMLVMEGTENSGYNVASFYRSSQPFPPSSLRKKVPTL